MFARPTARIACDESQTCSTAPQKMLPAQLKLKKSHVILFVFVHFTRAVDVLKQLLLFCWLA